MKNLKKFEEVNEAAKPWTETTVADLVKVLKTYDQDMLVNFMDIRIQKGENGEPVKVKI